MRTKVINVELSQSLEDIWVGEYESIWVLVRYHQQPLGAIWYSLPHPKLRVVRTQQLHDEIINQLGQQVLQLLFKQSPKQLAHPLLEPISIVVCTRDRTDQLDLCLQSLLNLDYPNYEVLVVDNAPCTDQTEKLAAKLPVRYVREDRPGLDWARNRGIAEAKNSIVAFTDDDVQVDRHWLSAIAGNFANPEIMAVTGLVIPAELETWPQLLFEFDYGGMGHGLKRQVIRGLGMSEQSLIWASSFGIGANMAFRRAVFDQIGTFDVALDVGTPSNGGGDVDIFHRVVAKGYTLVYDPAVLVSHTHRRHITALKKQLYDNGRSFGVYLITCARNQTVTQGALWKFWLMDWLYGWIISRLIRPPKRFPRWLVLTELAGMFSSVSAYRDTQIWAKQIAASYSDQKASEIEGGM